MTNKQTSGRQRPELLCPAGSPLALDAAIEGGADAVYLGGAGFNARMNAANFSHDDLISCIRRAHLHGVKVYLTLNTLVLDRELDDYIRAADAAACAGADALIVADLGGAAAIHRAIPELELHASTQASAHLSDAGRVLQDLGFSRMVVARELCLDDLRSTVKRSPIEIETFIHGALCVCHSGQCLFSSLVGGRSGNRGECAQPCRLPFRTDRGKPDYPLSLKDLSLAAHVPELLDAAPTSLKIEGRMRSPEYVLTVSRIWRKLLDAGRAATPDEMKEMADAFSRDGFTDGYFTDRRHTNMLGVRSEQAKQTARALTPFGGLTRRVPISLSATVKQDQPATLTARVGEVSYTASGDIPLAAINAPLDRATLERQLTKLGNTPFVATDCEMTLDEGLMMPISALNALRRAAVEGLLARMDTPVSERAPAVYHPNQPQAGRSSTSTLSATMADAAQLTASAAAYFDICYLPAHALLDMDEDTLRACADKTEIGVALPPVITDREREGVLGDLKALVARGIRRALVGNIGHLPLASEAGLAIDGDFRLNVTNTETVALLEQMGVHTPILSPELTLPQIRDIAGDVRTVVYGRIPLMLLEKCVIREVADCKQCDRGAAQLVDRRGVHFPVLRLPPHRNIIYNSLPTYMADAAQTLERHRTGGRHFIFSVETPAEVDAVIADYQAARPAKMPVRRIGR